MARVICKSCGTTKVIMLKKIYIEKFRSCENVEISDFSNFLVFVGKNGVGKTNIFRAIAWAAKQVKTGELSEEEPGSIYPAAVSLELQIGGKTLVYKVGLRTEFKNADGSPEFLYHLEESLSARLQDGLEDRIFIRKDGVVKVGIDGAQFPVGDRSMACTAVMALLPAHVVTAVVKEFHAFLSKVSYNHLDTPSSENTSRFALHQDYVQWQKSGELSNSDPSQVELMLLDMQLKNKDKFDEVISLLSHVGIIKSFEIVDLALDKKNVPRFHLFNWFPKHYDSDEPRTWTDLSFGTRRLIKLFVYFFYQDDAVFMLEQPEDGIHSGLLHQIIPMLRAYADGRQLFVATHSPEVMNASDPEEVRIVDFVGNRTSVRQLSANELEAACEYLRSDGPLFNFVSMIEG